MQMNQPTDNVSRDCGKQSFLSNVIFFIKKSCVTVLWTRGHVKLLFLGILTDLNSQAITEHSENFLNGKFKLHVIYHEAA